MEPIFSNPKKPNKLNYFNINISDIFLSIYILNNIY